MASIQEESSKRVATIAVKVADFTASSILDVLKVLLRKMKDERKATEQGLVGLSKSYEKLNFDKLIKKDQQRAAGLPAPPIAPQQIPIPLKMFEPYAIKHGFSYSAIQAGNVNLLLFRAIDKNTIYRGLSDFYINYLSNPNFLKPSLNERLLLTKSRDLPINTERLTRETHGKLIDLSKSR